MNSLALILCSLLYLAALFLIASWAEQRSRAGRSFVNSSYVYALSLAIYCTAWTFYGSVGRAASEGVEFMAVYIGPTLSAPLWWLVLRKIIPICKVQRITNIADFVSARYGKNRGLGVLVTLFCILGVIPYISIQIKAIATSFAVFSGLPATPTVTPFFSDQAFYATLLLALFAVLFGTRKLEATERHEGMVTAIAFESLVKLVAFVAVGAFVTFVLFKGPTDIFQQAALVPSLRKAFTFRWPQSPGNWFWSCLLSGFAILFLPRQFQVAVVENVDEKHLNKAMWLFPLYLFAINLFVLPLAFGGYLLLGKDALADSYVLSLPLQHGQTALTLLAYLGGFSAATSMIIVETTALSVMISNNLVMPLLLNRPRWQERFGSSPARFVLNLRRLAILGLLLLAYTYYRDVSSQRSLVSVGLISFAAVAQFAPAIIGGLFWKRGAKAGAQLGLIAGGTIWFYTLIIPTLVPTFLPASLLTDGPFGLALLKPQALFGLTEYDPVAHSAFWSLLINMAGYTWGSLRKPQSALDHNQAVLFVDVFTLTKANESPAVWKGKALITDLTSLLSTFFGSTKANHVVSRYIRRHQLEPTNPYADPRLVAHAERFLAGAVGAASARMLVSSVAKEEPIRVDEVIQILKTSQELLAVNKALKHQSAELQQLTQRLSDANERLKVADQQKDDFLSTVTHEIRTPITSIRAITEILYDNSDVDEETRLHFLRTVIKESERLTRLINQVLELERIESGRYRLLLEPVSINDIIRESVDAIRPLAIDKNLALDVQYLPEPLTVRADRDRLMQVTINLLSNAIKFSEEGSAPIEIQLRQDHQSCVVRVRDHGVGIDPAYQALIFEKFYQTQSPNTRKVKGSGLGLAISKKIIDLHNGTLSVESNPGRGSTFTFKLPLLP